MAKKIIIIEKGEAVDYQTVIEETVGMFLAENMDCYTEPEDLTEEFKKGKCRDDKSRAWFIAEHDYELTITKKRVSKYGL